MELREVKTIIEEIKNAPVTAKIGLPDSKTIFYLDTHHNFVFELPDYYIKYIVFKDNNFYFVATDITGSEVLFPPRERIDEELRNNLYHNLWENIIDALFYYQNADFPIFLNEEPVKIIPVGIGHLVSIKKEK